MFLSVKIPHPLGRVPYANWVQVCTRTHWGTNAEVMMDSYMVGHIIIMQWAAGSPRFVLYGFRRELVPHVTWQVGRPNTFLVYSTPCSAPA